MERVGRGGGGGARRRGASAHLSRMTLSADSRPCILDPNSDQAVDASALSKPPMRNGVSQVSPSSDQLPYARYSILRGLDFEDSQALGPVLEEYVKPLREPLVRWCALFTAESCFLVFT
jgi:hypothetical protein